MTLDEGARAFSEKQHRKGLWTSRSLATASPLARGLWNLISFKRDGVDRLAKRCRSARLGLELGCGNAAYSRWFLGKTSCGIVATDWSYTALRRIRAPLRGRILPVCADSHKLPFKPRSFDFMFTVDVLGHIPDVEEALDEVRRVMRPLAALFVHSECRDYERRWPDRSLKKRLGRDYLAELDGHWGLRTSSELREILQARFDIERFFSPAGVLGWLIGYPEKYLLAFRKAGWRVAASLTVPFSVLKKLPVAGFALRLVNALSNRLELVLGIVGGGSCFATGVKPEEAAERNPESSRLRAGHTA